MSDYEVSTIFTTTEDYSDYYDKDSHPYACDSGLRDFSRKFLAPLYSLVFILGFIGNGLVVCVLVKHRKQTNLTDICLLNLALSDLLFVLTLPFYTHYAVVGQWTFGDFMCRFVSSSHHSGFFSSIFFMIVMTLDRYMVIMYTHRVARYRTMRTGIILTVAVWMLSFGVSLPNFIFTKVINGSEGQECDYPPESKVWNHYSLFTTNILGLIFPLVVMVICYSRIIPILVNMRTAKKHRVVKLIISIIVIFFVFWAPYNITLFLEFLQSNDIISSECTWFKNIWMSIIITEAFAYTHCCLNPIIYAFVGQKFMKRVVQMLKMCMPGSSRGYSDSSARKGSVVSRSSDLTNTFIM